MLFAFWAVCGAVFSGLVTYFCDLCPTIDKFFIPLLLFVGGFLVSGVLYFTVLIIIHCFIDLKKPVENESKGFRFFVTHTVAMALQACNIKIIVRGKEKLPTDQRFLFVANHRSMFDPMTCMVALHKYNISFIAKPEVFKLPIASTFIHKCCFLSIDRDNNRAALKSILKAIDYLKRDQVSIGIFPEGTRSHDGELLEFKNGVFKIAQKAGVPIVVAVLHNAEKVSKNAPFKRTKVYIDIVDVLPHELFAEWTTTDIGDTVKKIMEKSL